MDFPPKNFEQLRLIVIKIRQGELDLAMGKKSFQALESMIEDADVVAMSNIVELATKTKLSSASITRLAKLLGFKGFQQFQRLFRQKSKMANSFYSDGVKNLINSGTENTKQLLNEQFITVTNNIEQGVNDVSETALIQAKSLLANKSRIYIFGYRHFASIANILRYGLTLLRPNVQMLVQENHGVAIALGQLKTFKQT